MTLSIAQQKKRQSNYNYLYNYLIRHLRQFENDYIENYAEWEVSSLEIRRKNIEEDIATFEKEEPSMRRDGKIGNLKAALRNIESDLSKKALIKMKAYNQAHATYVKRMENLANKLTDEDFTYAHLDIEFIQVNFGQLEFLISNREKSVHARMIYVNGEIKAPHFRFITTVRKKKD